MTSYVDELARLVGWSGPGVQGVDWRHVESELGVVLPPEYKEHVETFPYGYFQASLEILQPKSTDIGDVERYLDRVFDDAEALRGIPEYSELPYDVFPNVPGLFPWGRMEGEHILCWYLTGQADDVPPSYLVRIEYGRSTRLEGSMAECIMDAITGRTSAFRDLLPRVEPPSFEVPPPPPPPPPSRRRAWRRNEGFWVPRDVSYLSMVGLRKPIDAVESLLRLGLDTRRAQNVDWAAVERSLDKKLPGDYKRFIETIGPGMYGRILVASPSGPTPDAPDLFEILSDLRERLEAEYTNPPPVLPESGAPLVWGQAPNGYFCGWQLDDFPSDPNMQAVMRFTSLGGINGLNRSMTNYILWYLREGETFSTAPWSEGPGSARRRWKQSKSRRRGGEGLWY